MDNNKNRFELKNRLLAKVADSYDAGDNDSFNYATSILDSMKESETVNVAVQNTSLSQRFGGVALEAKGLYYDPNSQPIIMEAYFEAPRFFLKKGSELGYHLHMHETIGKKDTGALLTVVDSDDYQDVFAELHRKGSVKKAFNFERTSSEELRLVAMNAVDEIGHVPSISRRRPSKNAILIASIPISAQNLKDISA